ncbi:MAG: hypothetical protein JRI97_01030, partial [Deltaproteobacteria bacterium]|nr:hypothetical protein [Deltaproteobacteria bacterium]
LRGTNRALARAAFHLPLLGGRKSKSIKELERQWMAFLARAGIRPRVTSRTDTQFCWEVDACPWGFCRPGQAGPCDAAMDLDRTYTRLLGGELVIEERIAEGKTRCRFTTRLVS